MPPPPDSSTSSAESVALCDGHGVLFVLVSRPALLRFGPRDRTDGPDPNRTDCMTARREYRPPIGRVTSYRSRADGAGSRLSRRPIPWPPLVRSADVGAPSRNSTRPTTKSTTMRRTSPRNSETVISPISVVRLLDGRMLAESLKCRPGSGPHEIWPADAGVPEVMQLLPSDVLTHLAQDHVIPANTGQLAASCRPARQKTRAQQRLCARVLVPSSPFGWATSHQPRIRP